MSRVYKQNPRVATRNFRGEAAFISPEDRRINILNRTATEIWELCASEPRTLDALCVEMASRYAGDSDSVRNDVLELLDGLVVMGALLCAEDDQHPDPADDTPSGAAPRSPKPESKG